MCHLYYEVNLLLQLNAFVIVPEIFGQKCGNTGNGVCMFESTWHVLVIPLYGGCMYRSHWFEASNTDFVITGLLFGCGIHSEHEIKSTTSHTLSSIQCQ
jgi:hypothetical protein